MSKKSDLLRDVKAAIETDKDFRKAVADLLVSDEEFVQTVAQSVMSSKAADVGLNCPGSLVDFFRKHR